MSDRNAPVGVFDSGVGGLTVAREIMRQLPDERIVYFGDTARVPYGSKSRDTILRYSRQIIRFLRTKEVKAIVIACNTATALTLDTVAAESDIPIIGVINAGARDERFGGERQNRGTTQLVEKGTIALASERHCICFSARLGANPLLVAGKIGEKVQCFGVTIRAIITQAHSSGISRTIQIDETKTSFVSGK